MTENARLTDFTRDGETSQRPQGEAEAVAGNGTNSRPTEIVDSSTYQYPDSSGSIEIAVTQVNYTIEGSRADEQPILHVFGRTADNETEHIRVREFRPYFYAPTDSLDGPPETEYDRLTGHEDGYESIRGEPLTKVFGQTPRDVGQLRDHFDHYEADILFPNRLLIDKDITSGVRVPERRTANGSIEIPHHEIEPVVVNADLRINTFDIEVEDRNGFPEDGEEPIVCLTSHDSYNELYTVWLYESPTGEPGPDELPDYDPISGEIDEDVRRFDSEQGMLAAFLDYIEETDPDMVTAWNVEFDMPYLLDRLEQLGGDGELDPDRLSRVNEVWSNNWQDLPNIKGRVVFDLLYGYKRTQFTELESYRLDAVGEVELGIGKERYPGDIGDLWESNPEQLLEYNLRDVELCVELDRKQGIIPFWEEVASFVGCKLEDATTPGDAVDLYILHKVYGEFVLPSKGSVDAEEYEGGAVFEPITGVKEMVSVLDLKSLYPMAMVTTNASPETKVSPEYDGETYETPNDTLFRKEPDGIIREMVDELLTEREEKKAKRNEYDPSSAEYEIFDRQQEAVKVLMNSLYGVLTWDRFRLYDAEMGAAVTATGREVIKHTEAVADEMNKNVVYGDSVTGDRPIVVCDPDGHFRIVPIETLFEMADQTACADVLVTADGGAVGTASREKTRATLDGWDALSVDEGGDAEWRPITQVIRHESDELAVRLQHKFGESTTTRDHSYITKEEGTLTETPPEDVSEPLRVPTLPELKPIETVDVYDVLRGYEHEYEDGRGTSGTTMKTKRVHADDEYVWFGHEHHHSLTGTVKVQRHIEIESQDGRALLRLLGAYVTEGSASTAETTKSRFGASIAESRREWLEQLQADYHRLFENATTSIITGDSNDKRTVEYRNGDQDTAVTYNDRTLKLRMMNELSAVFFREFSGQTSHGKRIPSFVFHVSASEQRVFLDMIVGGDGSRKFPRYSDDYCDRNFDFETVSRRLAAGLSMLLTQRGKKHALKYRDSKNSYTIRTCDYYRSGRDPVLTETEHDGYVYDLSVAENENFVDGVGGIVLHNTDSVMLELGADATKESAIDQSFELAEKLNRSYDEFAAEVLNAQTHRFQIEFEKLYRRFFQAGRKKRYAGNIIWKEGKDVDDIDITGFEYKRSDIASITKEVQKRVIELIVTGEGKEAVTEYVHGVIERFQDGEIAIEELGIPGGIGKRLDNYDTDTAQVRGAKYANAVLGTNFQRGSKPKRIYLDRIHPDFFERVDVADDKREIYTEFRTNQDVICIEYADQLPDEFCVDWDKMLDKTLKNPIERILEAIGISWNEVKTGQEQTGLGQYM